MHSTIKLDSDYRQDLLRLWRRLEPDALVKLDDKEAMFKVNGKVRTVPIYIDLDVGNSESIDHYNPNIFKDIDKVVHDLVASKGWSLLVTDEGSEELGISYWYAGIGCETDPDIIGIAYDQDRHFALLLAYLQTIDTWDGDTEKNIQPSLFPTN